MHRATISKEIRGFVVWGVSVVLVWMKMEGEKRIVLFTQAWKNKLPASSRCFITVHPAHG